MNSGARARACRRRAGDGALADPSICVWCRALTRVPWMNFPGAENVRCALNRSDAVQTDQEILSPSTVLLLTDRGHIWVMPCYFGVSMDTPCSVGENAKSAGLRNLAIFFLQSDSELRPNHTPRKTTAEARRNSRLVP